MSWSWTNSEAEVAHIFTQVKAGLVDIHSRDAYGNTLLLLAAGNSADEMIRYLVGRGVNVNATNESGSSALLWALWRCSLEIVEFLIANGADVNHVKRDTGITPLSKALTMSNIPLVDLLLDCGAPMEMPDSIYKKAACIAVVEDNAGLLECLLRHGADIHGAGELQAPLLCCAGDNQSIETVEMLLAAGADITALDP